MRVFLHTILDQRLRIGLWVLGIFLALAGQTFAYESFTLNVSYYQGVDLNTGMTELDPTILTLKFGETEDVELVLVPQISDPFEFSPAVNFHFEYNSSSDFPVLLNPGNIQGIAVVDTSFDEVDPGILATLPFYTDLTDVALTETVTVLLLTQDNTYIKIGNIGQTPGFNVQFSYQQMVKDAAVPEPSTLFLLGMGVLILAKVVRSKKLF